VLGLRVLLTLKIWNKNLPSVRPVHTVDKNVSMVEPNLMTKIWVEMKPCLGLADLMNRRAAVVCCDAIFKEGICSFSSESQPTGRVWPYGHHVRGTAR